MKFKISKEQAKKYLKIYQADTLGWCRELSYTPTKEEITEALIMAYMALSNANYDTFAIKAIINNQRYDVRLPEGVTNEVVESTIDKALKVLSNSKY